LPAEELTSTAGDGGCNLFGDDESAGMTNTDQDLSEALRQVVRRGAADDAARVRGLLADFMPGMPALTRVAVAAVQEGVQADLRRAIAGGSMALAIARGVDRLVDQHGYDRSLATRVVQAWSVALDSGVVAPRTVDTMPTDRTESVSTVRSQSFVQAPTVTVDQAGDGDFRTIAAAVVAVDGADTTIRVKAGTYREALVLSGHVAVVADGGAGTVVVESAGAPAVEVREGSPLVRGLTLRVVANDAGGRADVPALLVTGGSPVVNGCDVSSATGDGIVVRGAGAAPLIRECVIHDARDYGVWVHTDGRGTFERCTVTGNAYAGIEVKQGGDPVVRGCTIADGKTNGIYVLENGRGTFEGCTVTGNAKAGIAVQQGGDPVVRECTFADGKDAGIVVHENGRGTFEGCTVTGNAKAGIGVTQGGDPVVRGCTIADGKANGIFVWENGRGTFERCTVTGNAYAGIEVKQGGDPVVRECTIARNRNHGVAVWATGRGTVTGCTLSGNAPGEWRVEVGAGGARRNNRPDALR
jgi:parallel beta-helix repeat protein